MNNNREKIPYSDMDFILKNKYLELSDWEAGFIDSIKDNCFFRHKYWVSEKQKKVFDRILDKAYLTDPGKNSIAEKYRVIFKAFKKVLDPIDEAHLSAYNQVYKENENIKVSFEMMLSKYGISRPK